MPPLSFLNSNSENSPKFLLDEMCHKDSFPDPSAHQAGA